MGRVADAFSIRVPSLKFVGLTIPNIWRTMCVSIHGPADPDLCSHLRWGTLIPNLGTLGFGFSNYSLCTRRTDGQTDIQKQRLLPYSLRAGAQQTDGQHHRVKGPV